MSYRYRIAETIRDVNEESWDALAGTEIAMTHRWMRVSEASRRLYRPRYILAEDQHGPLAAVALNTHDSFGRSGWREALLRRTMMVLSAPFSSRHCGIAVRPGASMAAALPVLEPALREVCTDAGRLFIGVSNVADGDLPAWRERGFFASPQPVHMVLDLPHASYDDYLRALPSKDRAEVRRVRRRGAELGVRLATGPLDGEADRLFPLLCEVFARHGIQQDAMPVTAAWLPTLEREMPRETLVVRGYVGEELAGFFLCMMHGEVLWGVAAGLHYALSRSSYVYFLLLDEIVRWGLEHGARRVYTGMTNERQKARHGFYPRSRWFCFRAGPRPLNYALGTALPLAQRLVGRGQATRAGQNSPDYVAAGA